MALRPPPSGAGATNEFQEVPRSGGPTRATPGNAGDVAGARSPAAEVSSTRALDTADGLLS
eukprot:1210298-Lingulodinium_polyedra.AAC.1